jgi:hypothetical protein
MKKVLFVFAILATMLLSACSLVDEVNNSLDYVNEAKSYINTLSEFGEQAPQLVQDAAVDQEARTELETQLNTIVEQAEEFNNLEAPAVAEDIHQDLVSKNEALLEEVNNVISDGEIALDKLENSELINTVNDVTSLLETIENLEL